MSMFFYDQLNRAALTRKFPCTSATLLYRLPHSFTVRFNCIAFAVLFT